MYLLQKGSPIFTNSSVAGVVLLLQRPDNQLWSDFSPDFAH